MRLAQVVANLLNNAAKFTPGDAPIRLRVRPIPGHVDIAVEDEGTGISSDLLPNVFDLFTQGEQGMDRHAGGLGLGLAIVKTLVSMHGGTVSAESDGLGHGARFTVRLPLAPHQEARDTGAALPPPAARHGGRVLLVDDNIDAAELLQTLLTDSGYDVRSAFDGPTALATLDSFTPDLALLDIGLPGMDGYELAGRLRADARLRSMKPLRIVALTGYGREPDRARALATHFDDHMVKPVAVEQLLATMARLLT